MSLDVLMMCCPILLRPVGYLLVVISLSTQAAMDPVVAPVENPITEAKRVLGKVLFWDEQLSSDDTVACGTCHRPAAGGADPRQAIHPGPDGLFETVDDVIGSAGIVYLMGPNQAAVHPLFGLQPQVTDRATPSFLAAMYAPSLFWDGRAGSEFIDPQVPEQVIISSGGALENQALGPILSSVEMAHEGRVWQDVIDKLEAVTPLQLATNIPADMAAAIVENGNYPALFNSAFGDNSITAARIGMAIATYERTLVPDQSPWDLYMAGDTTAMSEVQITGWESLDQDTVCLNCHVPPLFSDNLFHNIGLRPSEDDLGFENTTGQPQDRGRFKTPSLRNVGLRPSLMHVGWVTDNMDAIDFYNADTEDITSNHVQFTEDQTPIPTEDNRGRDYTDLSMFAPSESRQAEVADFLTNGLTDPRVATEVFPFDRPTLASEIAGEAVETDVVKVMSYNVNFIGWSDQRADLIAETINEQRPDIVSLQEAGATPLPDLQLRLSDNYDFFDFTENGGNGNTILTRKNRFNLLTSGTTAEGEMLSCVRDRYISYLVLEEAVSEQRLTFYNAQFCAQQTTADNLPDGFTATEVNESHAATLAKLVAENIEIFGGAVVIAGDLNANNSSATINFLLDQSPLPDGATNAVALVDSWVQANDTPKTGVDWILLLAGSATVVSAERIDNSVTQAASDHLPITATIELASLVNSGDVLTVVNRANQASEQASIGSSDVVMARFSLQCPNGICQFSSITLQAQGDGDDSASIESVTLYVDENADGVVDGGDTHIGEGRYATDNGLLHLQLETSLTLTDSNTEFMVVYDF